ncbi:MAG: hypothetical protein GXY88_03350 [Tissierellia bacterium]|nr:hypothetical protein [Tissierellia bacterium]
MENLELEKKKRPRKWLILVTVFIIIPLAILSLIYFNNVNFRSRVNNLLGKLPGVTGEYFRTIPTEEEREDKKLFLADYFLSLDPKIAADKLYIVKKDDERLYSEIVRLMNSKAPSKTEEIIKLIRNMELRKDLLFSIHDEIQEEKRSQFMEEVNRLESQDLLLTINEIENRIEMDSAFEEKLPDLIALMDESRAADILFYIDEGIKDGILYSLSNDKKTSLESKISEKMIKQNNLIDLAAFYELKPVEVAIEEIGNTENYSVDELALIYKNLSVLKSGEILSKLDDDDFIQDLFTSIRRIEDLMGEEASITNEISKSIQFLTEYNRKIDDLVLVYEKMNPDRVAKIVEQMIDNNATVTALEINSEPVLEISDASIAIDVLSRMKNKSVSNIMNYISTDKASRLTQLLAKP